MEILPFYLRAGYGNIAPVSTAGRVFCIFFSIVGIPFTLSVIINVGQGIGGGGGGGGVERVPDGVDPLGNGQCQKC